MYIVPMYIYYIVLKIFLNLLFLLRVNNNYLVFLTTTLFCVQYITNRIIHRHTDVHNFVRVIQILIQNTYARVKS